MFIRTLKESDLEEVEQLIKETIIHINAKDCSKSLLEAWINIEPYIPRKMYHEREYFVYDENGIKGIIGVKENEIKTFFVDARSQGKGIGKALLSHAHKIIAHNNWVMSFVYSSVSAKTFYEHNGYYLLQEDMTKMGDNLILRYYMKKDL